MPITTLDATRPIASDLTDGPQGVIQTFQNIKAKVNEIIGKTNALDTLTLQDIQTPSPGVLTFLVGDIRVTTMNYAFGISAGAPANAFINYPIVYSEHPVCVQMQLLTTPSTQAGVMPMAIADDPAGSTGTRAIVSSAQNQGVTTTIGVNVLIIGKK